MMLMMETRWVVTLLEVNLPSIANKQGVLENTPQNTWPEKKMNESLLDKTKYGVNNKIKAQRHGQSTTCTRILSPQHIGIPRNSKH